MEIENEIKKRLLETPMNEFKNFGSPFVNCFEREKFMKGRNYRIPTLEEFIGLNSFLKYDTDEFRDFYSEIPLFSKKSGKWNNLRDFLIERGFTSKDWMMLIPKKIVGSRNFDDFSVLSKEQILTLPIQTVCPGKTTRDMDYVTVKDVLKMDVDRPTPGDFILQKKLKELGFTYDDGDIMTLINTKEKSSLCA